MLRYLTAIAVNLAPIYSKRLSEDLLKRIMNTSCGLHKKLGRVKFSTHLVKVLLVLSKLS